MQKQIEQTLDSREVADMVGKTHANLLKDIRSYIEQLAEVKNHSGAELGKLKIQSTDFFRENTYSDRNRQERPCYDITKKGCEFIAHKLTGVKGTAFTAQYINRFHNMEEIITQGNTVEQPKFILCLQGLKFVADDLRVSEASKLQMYNGAFEKFGLPTSFLPKYEDNGSRERCSATTLLKRNGCALSTAKFNQLLLNMGYLEERERPSSNGGTKKFKALTDKGLTYGVNLINEKNQKEVQPYYYADTFTKLLDILEIGCNV